MLFLYISGDAGVLALAHNVATSVTMIFSRFIKCGVGLLYQSELSSFDICLC